MGIFGTYHMIFMPHCKMFFSPLTKNMTSGTRTKTRGTTKQQLRKVVTRCGPFFREFIVLRFIWASTNRNISHWKKIFGEKPYGQRINGYAMPEKRQLLGEYLKMVQSVHGDTQTNSRKFGKLVIDLKDETIMIPQTGEIWSFPRQTRDDRTRRSSRKNKKGKKKGSSRSRPDSPDCPDESATPNQAFNKALGVFLHYFCHFTWVMGACVGLYWWLS